MERIVIIGAGQAAASCIAKLRGEGYDGHIALIGAEPHLPYQRPPLSKAYLLGDMDVDRLALRPADWYADQNIDLYLGRRATVLHARDNLVELDGGDALSFDHCILATGAHPRQLPGTLGGDLDGVYYMRDLADADALAPEVAQGRNMVIIGGGYIGLEAAAVAAKRGMNVTLIEAGTRILQRVACAETSDYMRDLHQSHGVTILEDTSLVRLQGDGHVTGAELADGRVIPADVVVVGIGVTPASVLADTAGLAVENGIAVDTHGRTSVPSIWAIGDCAAFPLADGYFRLESVGNAIDMGELVARNIMGANAEYAPKAWFWSDQYDVKLQIAGLNLGYDRVVTRDGDGDGDGRSHWYFRGDDLIAVDAMNDPRAYMVGKRLIEGGKAVDPAAVADPTTDLKALMR